MKTKKDTKDLLLEITFDEVYTYGYQGTSVLKILEKANLNKGSLYHYFKNKKELVLAAIDVKSEEIFGQKYKEVLNGNEPYLENFEKMLINMYEFAPRGCPLANLIQEMSNNDEEFDILLKNKYQALKNIIEEILKKALENNELTTSNISDLSLFVLSGIEGAIVSAKTFKNKSMFEKNLHYLFKAVQNLG